MSVELGARLTKATKFITQGVKEGLKTAFFVRRNNNDDKQSLLSRTDTPSASPRISTGVINSQNFDSLPRLHANPTYEPTVSTSTPNKFELSDNEKTVDAGIKKYASNDKNYADVYQLPEQSDARGEAVKQLAKNGEEVFLTNRIIGDPEKRLSQNFISKQTKSWQSMDIDKKRKTDDILRQNPSQECKDFIFNYSKSFTKMQPKTMQKIADILNDDKTPKTVKAFMMENHNNIKSMDDNQLRTTAHLMIDQDRHIPKFMHKMLGIKTPQTEHDNKLRTLLTNNDAMGVWSKLDAGDMKNIMDKPFCEQMQEGKHLPEKNKADAFLAFL